MEFSAQDAITFLTILAIVMAVIVLYHVIFIVIRVRKITERVDDVTKEVEGMIMKPLSLMEESMAWVTEFLLSMYGESKKDHSKKSKHK